MSGGAVELPPPRQFDVSDDFWIRAGFGFAYWESLSSEPSRYRSTGHLGYGVSFPAWLLILPMMPSAMLRLSRKRRAAHHARCEKKGGCTVCGYDLRASIARCPECGTPIPKHELHMPAATGTAARGAA